MNMKRFLWAGVVACTVNVIAVSQDFRRVVDIVTEMESSLTKMVSQERSDREGDVAALRKDLADLRGLLQAPRADDNWNQTVEQRLASLEARLAALSKPATAPPPAPAAEADNTVTWSVQERARIESWDNATSLSRGANQANSYTRNRTSLALTWKPVSALETGLKFTNEFRTYFAPLSKDFTWNEAFVDQAYVRWTFTAPVEGSVVAGRQNIVLGEGFVVLDGTPLDGSRSQYFDGLRVDVAPVSSARLTAFAVDVPRIDRHLPVINPKDQLLTDTDTRGWGVYGQIDVAGMNLQPYAIHRQSDALGATVSSRTTLLGGRVKAGILPALTWVAEGGWETGSVGRLPREAVGGYTYAEIRTGWPAGLPQTIVARYIYLDGDNPATTGTIESWDPMFGRWPKWSESYLYTLTKENGVAYWSNMISVGGSVRSAVSPGVEVNLDYQYLTAPQHFTPGPAFPGGTGTTRGNLLSARITYKLSAIVSGHVVWEHFKPGDYYFSGASEYNWSRVEFLFNLPQ